MGSQAIGSEPELPECWVFLCISEKDKSKKKHYITVKFIIVINWGTFGFACKKEREKTVALINCPAYNTPTIHSDAKPLVENEKQLTKEENRKAGYVMQ